MARFAYVCAPGVGWTIECDNLTHRRTLNSVFQLVFRPTLALPGLV